MDGDGNGGGGPGEVVQVLFLMETVLVGWSLAKMEIQSVCVYSPLPDPPPPPSRRRRLPRNVDVDWKCLPPHSTAAAVVGRMFAYRTLPATKTTFIIYRSTQP